MFDFIDEEPMPELTEEAMQFIKDHGLPTGSQVIGGQQEWSDYDFVMDVRTTKGLDKLQLFKFNIRPEVNDIKNLFRDYFLDIKSCKFWYGGMEINLIVVPDEVDVEAWKFATKEIASEFELIRDKESRVNLFELKLIKFYVDRGLPMRCLKLRHKQNNNV